MQLLSVTSDLEELKSSIESERSDWTKQEQRMNTIIKTLEDDKDQLLSDLNDSEETIAGLDNDVRTKVRRPLRLVSCGCIGMCALSPC